MQENSKLIFADCVYSIHVWVILNCYNLYLHCNKVVNVMNMQLDWTKDLSFCFSTSLVFSLCWKP